MRVSSAFAHRLDVTVLILLGLLVFSGPAAAQGDPGANVNIIGLTLDPDDFPDENYRQQNEPSCAMRPDDSTCMICAYNDYRAVDVIGDAWQGVSQSCNAGDSWLSRLAPGSAVDTVAPVPAAFAADPRFQHIPGLAILNFIAGFRDSNEGVLAIQHWLPVNKEDADHYEPDRETYIADAGTDGRFIDKPDMLAVLDPANQQGTIQLSHVMENQSLGDNGVIERAYPTGKLFVGYAVFTGSSSIKVLVKVSEDWGQTWPNQVIKLSEDQNAVSGLSLTANKTGSKVLAIWRRIGDNNETDAIMYSVISQQGNNLKATKGEVLAEVCAFDQPTLGGTETPAFPLVAFRTNDFPWAASDGDNFFVFYSDLGRTNGTCNPFPFPEGELPARPRIVVHHSSSGSNWSDPIVVDDRYVANDRESAHPASFQFMPSAFGANGRVQLAWYDTRREAAEIGSLPLNQQVPYVADHLDGPPDAFFALIQRKVDVYTTSMTIDQVEAAEAMQADSDPANDFDGGIPDPVRVTQYSIVVSGDEALETEASFANKKLFKQGTLPFLGDYIAMAARQFRKVAGSDPNNPKYESNADFIGGLEDFFVAWTSNRDVSGEVPTIDGTLPYTADNALEGEPVIDGDPDNTQMLARSESQADSLPPRDGMLISEGIDGSDPGAVGTCSPNLPPEANFDRSRDANIYGSLIKDSVRVSSPTPSKPLGGVMRAFVVSVANAEDFEQTFWLTIDNQPCSDPTACRATFRQLPATPPFALADDPTLPQNEDLLVEQLMVPANSTLARTVFIVGTAETTVRVLARQGSASGTPISSVELGDAATLLDPDICAGGDCSVADSELHNLTLGNLTLGNLTLGNAELIAEAIRNLTLGNLTLGNLTLGNLTLGNLTLGNLTLGNLTLGNLTLGNATLANTTLVNTALDSGELTESSTYEELLIWALDPANGIDPALLDPTVLGLTFGNDEDGNGTLDPEELYNLTLGNLTLGNLTLGNLTLGNLTLGNLTLGNASEPNLTLGNLTLGNTSLGNLTLGNAALADPVLNEATCPPNPDGTPADCTVTGLSFDDYTYPLTNKGNVTTAIDADITIDGQVAATQLITWKANVTATSINCEGQLLLEEGIQAVVNNPDQNLAIADINAPFNGDTSIVAGAGETVFVTYRVWGTPAQLKNVKVTGFTASSQAANCRVELGDDGKPVNICSPNLNQDIEKIIVDGPPVITLNTGDVTLEATSLDGAEFTFSASAVDIIDGDVPVTCNHPFTDIYPLGDTDVICEAFDSATNGASKSFTVTVEDTSAPSIDPVTPPTDFSPDTPYPFELDPDASEITVFWPVSAFDADENLTFSCTIDGVTFGPDAAPIIVDGQVQATFDYSFPVGDTQVSCTVSDSNGLEATTQFTVSVLDVTPPSAPAAPTQDLNGTPLSAIPAADGNGATVSWGTLYAQDAVSGQLEAVCVPASGSLFPIGPTEVSCTATDDAGLQSAATTFTVTVVDAVAPVIAIGGNNPDTVAEDSGTYADLNNASASDNVDASVTVIVSGWNGDTSNPGVYTIFYDAIDSAGNAATQLSRQVTVTDGTAPFITLNGLNPDSVDEDTVYNDPGATAVDNVDGPVVVNATILDTSEPGQFTVTYTASDGVGNTSTTTRTVNVLDKTPPVITVAGNNPDSVVEDTGIYADLANASASDNFDATVAVITSGWDGDTSAPGNFTIYYDATDLAGNAATQVSRTVTVTDGTPPVISATDRVETLDYADGSDPDYASVPGYFDHVTADDGGTPLPVSCMRDPDVTEPPVDPNLTDTEFEFRDAPYNITCTATDASSNSATASFALTVRYLYDINLIPPKGRARAGSTVPLDWQYLDRFGGNPVDGSNIDVRVAWAKMTSSSCLTRDTSSPEGSSGIGDDSGNSDFRYSSSNDTWQFSWQTPDVLGWHKVTVSPPGGNVKDAWECINLR